MRLCYECSGLGEKKLSSRRVSVSVIALGWEELPHKTRDLPGESISASLAMISRSNNRMEGSGERGGYREGGEERIGERRENKKVNA